MMNLNENDTKRKLMGLGSKTVTSTYPDYSSSVQLDTRANN